MKTKINSVNILRNFSEQTEKFTNLAKQTENCKYKKNRKTNVKSELNI